MIESARWLALAEIRKTIVLVGSSLPEKMKDSDADVSLGFGLAAVQLLPRGVFIAMNGQAHA